MLNSISIVDDDQQVTNMLSVMIQRLGYETKEYTDVKHFLDMDHRENDLLIIDLCMPSLDGVEVIRELANQSCRSHLILMSGQDEGVLKAAKELAFGYDLDCVGILTKPISVSSLKELIQQLSQDVPESNIGPEIGWLPSAEEVEEAIDSRELILHYQPQVNLQSGCVVGLEALVRWEHPERGLLFPNTFLQVAQKAHLMEKLTALVIEVAINDSTHWQDSDVSVSVNISAGNITSLTLPEHLFELVNAKKLDSSKLILEITESELMGELVTSLDILTRLRMKGFGLSIDDFGTGYSSLSQLHRIPFTELKIDQTFVAAMTYDKEALAIVETCEMLGRKLNMKIVAEGVETEEQYRTLRAMGCDCAQGYYIARPMCVDQVFDWVHGEAFSNSKAFLSMAV